MMEALPTIRVASIAAILGASFTIMAVMYRDVICEAHVIIESKSQTHGRLVMHVFEIKCCSDARPDCLPHTLICST